MTGAEGHPSAWDDAVLAAVVFASDPAGTGAVLRGPPGPVRDRWLALVNSLLPAGAPVRRLPLNIADDRLLGGLDLAATLAAGRPVAQRGLLAESNGGVLVMAMAERLPLGVVARVTAALDRGEVAIERDGFTDRAEARFGFIALDEGVTDDERAPEALRDRAAFHLDFSALRHAHMTLETLPFDASKASARLSRVQAADEAIATLTEAAAAFGVASLRAICAAVRVARIAAALAGRDLVADEDVVVAARLALAPRATRLPEAEPPPQVEEPDAPPPADDGQGDEENAVAEEPLGDRVLAAIKASIPEGLLDRLRRDAQGRARAPSSGRAGASRKSQARGRPIGARRGELRSGARLNLVETLRAAAPWQRIRRAGEASEASRVHVRREDFRITRFKHRAASTTVFLVDASGSTALHRLAEAKGAVELLLAESYARRDSIALIAFRGRAAELVLPPTRALARAKRGLAGLPGGGGTPLALGIDAAVALCEAVRGKGQTPCIVLLTDGRANVGRDPNAGRGQAESDALAAARSVRLAGLKAVVIDTSPRPEPKAARLASEMDALYAPLPYATAATLSDAVRAARGA